MTRYYRLPLLAFGLLVLVSLQQAFATADLVLPGLQLSASGSSANQTSTGLKLLLALTVLSLVPAILVSITAFVRIVIVLSLLRHALGMQETPPNTVLLSLALFLTLFTMSPALKQANEQAFQPYLKGKYSTEQAVEKGFAPFRDFMVRQTREEDLALMVEISKSPAPRTVDDIGNLQLIPAFMLSELRTAFQIGFVIFLPFLLVDLIVSAILMGLGMMMVPPVTISLPLKILMFVMIDGWGIVVRSLLSSFN
ncbi:flagellar type III secretion system pore protein FliP [Chitinimonas sp. BJB300]|uniref:flagellar type III secretion system pore protein FliP n=1 Tax=Chitinimonas sp. BJB300 TaxID=1559339 RepID=UPI000C0E869D|nr:flagellar type III secretion system pore protein FliP [Chitinimonas sp. BJB300]PHV12865.1 flagellar biosynthetic protein FliP [Chitinimonas sp. BJB300]TSJ86103.1 flagellar type III secretion system pore protein FliP [Chitinimonas sp. BJB300]